MIRHEKGKWVLHFSDGRKEEFDSEEAAKHREAQINYFVYLDKKKHK